MIIPTPKAYPGVTHANGSISQIAGVTAIAIDAGLTKKARLNLGLLYFEHGATAAGLFTQNQFAAAPVMVSKRNLLASDKIYGCLINAGQANAATGRAGDELAESCLNELSQQLEQSPSSFVLASTGVIGVLPDAAKMSAGITSLAKAAKLGAKNGKNDIAQAILTTDLRPKTSLVSFTATESDGTVKTYQIGGICKGSGMMAPNMATMLAFIATDCDVEKTALQTALQIATGKSFNQMSVDECTSTNDSVLLFSTGATVGKQITTTCPLFEPFVTALTAVCVDLARQIVGDGEGMTKLITVQVNGGAADAQAREVARLVATSQLVRTAVRGQDANWGRIIQAIGNAACSINVDELQITLLGETVYTKGGPASIDEAKMRDLFKANDEVIIAIDLANGQASTEFWSCDLTEDYIKINADYRS